MRQWWQARSSRNFTPRVAPPTPLAGPLAAADRAHDLQPVAARDGRVRVAAPRHDLAVLLDGDALAREAEPRDEFRDGVRVRDIGRAAVQGQCEHDRRRGDDARDNVRGARFARRPFTSDSATAPSA